MILFNKFVIRFFIFCIVLKETKSKFLLEALEQSCNGLKDKMAFFDFVSFKQII